MNRLRSDAEIGPADPSRPRHRTMISAVILVLATVAILRALGRSWWCACATPHIFVTAVWSSHNSQHLLDPYTFSHVQHGLLLYGLLAVVAPRIPIAGRAVIAIGIECAWEILENTHWIIDKYRESTVSVDYYGDSIVNSLSDIAACAIGFWIAATAPVAVSVAALVAVEAAMIMLIRDSLLLNVLMIIYPMEAIKTWQSGG